MPQKPTVPEFVINVYAFTSLKTIVIIFSYLKSTLISWSCAVFRLSSHTVKISYSFSKQHQITTIITAFSKTGKSISVGNTKAVDTIVLRGKLKLICFGLNIQPIKHVICVISSPGLYPELPSGSVHSTVLMRTKSVMVLVMNWDYV